MKIVEINTVCNGSTGNIMLNIASNIPHQTYCFYGRGNNEKGIKIDNKFSVYFHALIARLFNKNGHGSYFATKKMIKKIKEIDPDVIHLHNIHGYYLNIKLLFDYLKNDYKGKVIWTLHDCWAFTGHCSHFVISKCSKWQKKCHNCPNLKDYPKTLIDRTEAEYFFKKETFTNVPNMTIVTVSNWLKDLVKKSFLKDYRIEVVSNGININIFKPNIDKKVLEKYDIPKNKKIILGVANIWEDRKGLNIFLELATKISKDEIIVLVGVDGKLLAKLPENIIGIKRTDNINELVTIYSVADVFLNPSLEETFSLVTVEALACGTPAVVTNTSAVKELVSDGAGFVVDNDINLYFEKINYIIKNPQKFNKMLETAKKYKLENNVKNYLKLYEE